MTTIFDQKLHQCYPPTKATHEWLVRTSIAIRNEHRLLHAYHRLQQRLNHELHLRGLPSQPQLPEITMEYLRLVLPEHYLCLDTSGSVLGKDTHHYGGQQYNAVERWAVSLHCYDLNCQPLRASECMGWIRWPRKTSCSMPATSSL